MDHLGGCDRFSEDVKAGEAETNEAERYRLFKKACLLYRGEFLPELSGEDWVIIKQRGLQKAVFYGFIRSVGLPGICTGL